MNRIMVYCLALVFLGSCKKEKAEPETSTASTYANGRYIVNEGSYGANNASISFLGDDGEILNDLYLRVNGFDLGDVLQSFMVSGEYGYAVLNNSQKVEIIRMRDFRHVKTIDGLSYPRHIVKVSDQKAYISNGAFEGSVFILDLQTHEITGSIYVGYGPENMLVSNGFVYVCNSGGWAEDNTVSVIDSANDQVVATLTVGDRPVDLAAESNGDVWVLCSGKIVYDENWNVIGETEAGIWRIDAAQQEVMEGHVVGVLGDHPYRLEANSEGNVLFYLNNGIFAVDLTEENFPGEMLIEGDKGSLNVDPNDGNIWTSSPSDFTNPSTVFQYSSSGELVKTYTAGIGTSAVIFHH